MITASELLGEVRIRAHGRFVPAMSAHDDEDAELTAEEVKRMRAAFAQAQRVREHRERLMNFSLKHARWVVIGQLIDERRAAMGLTRKEAAEAIGTTVNTITGYIRAKVPVHPKFIEPIREVYGIDIPELLK